MSARTTDADHYIDGKNVAKTSVRGEVDHDFDLAGRRALSVDLEGLRQSAGLDDALLLSSQTGDDVHKPVIDVDVPIRVIPSSTPGHSHLYIDVEMSWDQYKALLDALNVAGIVEPGYVFASVEREATHVRLPWVTKGAES